LSHNSRRMALYIYDRKEWPEFQWDHVALSSSLPLVRFRQGRLAGRMEALGFPFNNEAILATLTLDVLKSTEIEGEVLNPKEVRSSIARHLGMDIAGLVASDRFVDGVVEMMLDATQNYALPLTEERLFTWHSALFPTGRSGMHKIIVGNWRDNQKGPMQVVSGPMGKEKVHFEAPDADRLPGEMKKFLHWFNTIHNTDPVLKAAVAHLWFLTIHPFDDGNGRMARAIADMQLARAEKSSNRFYSMSAQIRKQRKGYYAILEKTQKGNTDVTAWMKWFLDCLDSALDVTEDVLTNVLKKARFWEANTHTGFNERQHLMLNKMLDGFKGKLTSSKWAKITKCSQDTALRDIQSLLEKGILAKEAAAGRSTNYVLK
jgi:Fic family protein